MSRNGPLTIRTRLADLCFQIVKSTSARFSALALSLAALAAAQVNVLNVNYDVHQTGANLQETALSPQTNWNNFGKVGTLPVDAPVYAQPLYVTGVTIGGTQYNVVYVATMNNSVFAFNADAPQSAEPLWQVNLGAPVPSGLYNFTDILPQIGILGTPAIDAASQVMYVVADTLPPGAFSDPVFQLHALSLEDGHEMYGGPVEIAASVAGTGAGSSNGAIAFDAFWQLQRPGLMLANDNLYIAFGSHGDAGNYQGWMMEYGASTLRQKAVYNSAPNGRQAAFWHSGRAPAIDGNGNVIAVTGNGNWDGVANFGESLLYLSGADLSLLDWFTPQEWASLNTQDWDLGSAGAILIPGQHYLLTGGKAGMLYSVNYDSMGHLSADNTATVQGVQVNDWGIFNMALWEGPPNGPFLYEYDPAGTLKAYQIQNNQINSTIFSKFTPANSALYAGVSVSASGSQNGVVWFVTGNANASDNPATLYALDATNLSNPLWSSDTNSARDQPGVFTKFTPPMVANGRVYLATLSNAVAVYGVLGSSQGGSSAAISAAVNSASFVGGPVAPGELITIFGANLGPPSAAQGSVASGVVSDTVQSTQVLIGGTAAPLLYVSPTQINTIVPFRVSGTSTQIQVVYQGQTVASTSAPVEAASPAVFSMNGNGGGQGAILNQNGSVNASSNPAAPGSVVAIYATGAGLTTPASTDGAVTTAPYPKPNLAVSVTIDGLPAQVLYAGAAPGLVAGVLQIDAVVPADAYAADYDQVVVTIGDYTSPSAIMMTVK